MGHLPKSATSRLRELLTVLLISLAAANCGGGGSTPSPPTLPSPPPPPPPPPPMTVLTGQFKDANTEGLTFSTMTQAGVTDANGTFQFLDGETVEFAVGGVSLGSAPGARIVSPIDFVAGADATSTEVTNRVRFLMLLDQNEDPTDGITISSSLQLAAENWSQVDFTASDFASELVMIASDVASIEGRTADIRTAQEASNHLTATQRCLMSGLFVTRFDGMRELLILVDPVSGGIKASYSNAATDFVSVAPVGIDQTRAFRLVAGNDSFEGRFDSFDIMSGVWNVGNSSGDFTASRRQNDSSALFRFTGEWFRNTVSDRLRGVMVLHVDEIGAISAAVPEIGGSDKPASGSLVDSNITIDVDGGTEFSGMVDSDLVASMTGIGSGSGDSLIATALGCRLN